MLEINEKLRESILSKIPKSYSKLQKMVCIYYHLCKKLEYSLAYFLSEEDYFSYFTDPKNLKYVDGVENNEVVCYTFTAILAQLLVDAGICSEEWLNKAGVIEKTGKLGRPLTHKDLVVEINHKCYTLDAVYSIISESGLNDAKLYNTIVGIDCDYGDDAPLWRAIDKVQKDVNKIYDLEKEYKKCKTEKRNYIILPLEDRKNLFLQMANSSEAPKYSTLTFAYYLKLKHLLFSREEYKESTNTKIEIEFVFDNFEKNYKCLFLFNKKGYLENGGKNLKETEIYEISPENKTITKLCHEEFAQRCKEQYCYDCGSLKMKNVLIGV